MSERQDQVVLKLKNIWVSFNGKTVLEGVNLTVYKSDFLGIIGPNGGGKTTLLKVIMGMIKPDRGEIRFSENKFLKDKSEIGYVPQSLNYDRSFPINVWDMVLLGRIGRVGLFKRFKNYDKEIAAEVLNKVEMYEFKDKQLGELSGGQLQRILIARALAGNPEILLLDEPTSGIDNAGRENVYNLFKDLNEEIPIILVSHDMGFISSYVDKIACLNRKLYYHGSQEVTPETLYKVYGCAVELIAHGVPHRVLEEHIRMGERER